MIENAHLTLVWLLPLLGVSIWLQRAASFLVPKTQLKRPLLVSLNRWAPMGVIAVLVLVSLDTGVVDGWRGIALEVVLLTGLGALYMATRQVLLTVVLAAAAHWLLTTNIS